jgi:hypothetical protein
MNQPLPEYPLVNASIYEKIEGHPNVQKGLEIGCLSQIWVLLAAQFVEPEAVDDLLELESQFTLGKPRILDLDVRLSSIYRDHGEAGADAARQTIFDHFRKLNLGTFVASLISYNDLLGVGCVRAMLLKSYDEHREIYHPLTFEEDQSQIIVSFIQESLQLLELYEEDEIDFRNIRQFESAANAILAEMAEIQYQPFPGSLALAWFMRGIFWKLDASDDVAFETFRKAADQLHQGVYDSFMRRMRKDESKAALPIMGVLPSIADTNSFFEKICTDYISNYRPY